MYQDRFVWAEPIPPVIGVQPPGALRVIPSPSVAMIAMSKSPSTVPLGLFPLMDVPEASPLKVKV